MNRQAPSVLAVFAHPDDESLSAGGALAKYAAAGARTAVVTATWAPGTPRAAELAAALTALGAGEPRLLGYADARVPHSAPGAARLLDAPLDEAEQRLVAHIRDFQPDLVLTHDAHGGMTGHPDHVQTHLLTTLAVRAAGTEAYPDAGAPWDTEAVYLATHPHSAVRTLHRYLTRIAGPAWKADVQRSTPDDQVSVALDVAPWLRQKWTAIQAHASEAERGAAPGLLARLPEAVRTHMLRTEWYLRYDPASSTGGRAEEQAAEA